MLARNAPNAYCTAASAAHTAVSVRRIFAPSATSDESASACRREFRVGPSALGTDRDGHAGGIVHFARDDATGSSTSRNGLAPARSESNNFSGAVDARNASRGFAASRSNGNAQPPRLLRGFREDSSSIVRRASLPRQSVPFRFGPLRAARFRPLRVRSLFRAPTRTGQTSQWPAAIRSERTQSAPASCSTSENWTSSRPTLSVRASHTLSPSLSSYNCPVSARSTRPRWCAASPRRVAEPGAKFFHKESPSHVPLCYINPMSSRAQPACAPLFTALSASFRGDCCALFSRGAARAQTPPRPSPLRRAVIVDTDAGADDLMAIAFLLSRPDIHVEAITIENGMAHVPAGRKKCAAPARARGPKRYSRLSRQRKSALREPGISRGVAPALPTNSRESLFRSPRVPSNRAARRTIFSSACWMPRTRCKSSRSARSRISPRCFHERRARPARAGNS